MLVFGAGGARDVPVFDGRNASGSILNGCDQPVGCVITQAVSTAVLCMKESAAIIGGAEMKLISIFIPDIDAAVRFRQL